MKRQIRRLDKKKFNPNYVTAISKWGFDYLTEANRHDRKILEQWRNAGWSRLAAYSEFTKIQDKEIGTRLNKDGEREYYTHTLDTSYRKPERLRLEKLRSTAYQHVFAGKKGRTIIDAGCGSSPDTLIALEHDGFKKAYRVDYYEYTERDWKTTNLIADISKKVSKIPKGKADVVVCQAVLDLLDAHERDGFYKEANRWLKKGGMLSVYIVNLVLGYGFDIGDEKEAAARAGFEILQKFNGGFVARKR